MEVTCKSDLDDFSQLNVLIIDDNRLIHDALKNILFDLGFRNVRCAENAYYGLRLADEMRFHIIICAFNVKSDKDGFHLLEELKFKGHIKKTTILIFLSTETDECLVNSIVELQPDDFWVKPLSPKLIRQRLLYTLEIKKQLFAIYHSIDKKEFSKVVYYADRLLTDKSLKKYHSNLLRMKGEALLSLLEFKDAEAYFHALTKRLDYAWVHIGYVRSLLKQGRIDEINTMLEQLTSRVETRFATHDMLAQYYLENKRYDLAYEEIKKATALSPRNIERNKKSWDLARLNHDHLGQFQATRNIAKFAKNSIHDSPVLLLNVMRAAIDLASTITDGSSEKVLEQAEHYMRELEREYDNASEFKQQLYVVQARIHNARDEKKRAEKIVENHLSLQPTPSLEDNLDKVKVLHELGMREEAIDLLAAIKKQIAGDSLSSEVVSKYIEQESDERSEIHFTPKELNSMAVEYLQKNKVQPALDTVALALKLAPNNVKLQFSLLKILLVLKEQDELENSHKDLADKIICQLEASKLDDKKVAVFNDLRTQWLAG